MNLQELENAYIALRESSDDRIATLSKQHKAHMRCKSGCYYCCEDFGLLPIEFFLISKQLKNGTFARRETTKTGECPFLIDTNCAIYAHRPMICRNQGSPLLFMDDDIWSLSVCELNFTEVADDFFNEGNTYSLDTYNSKLYMLNAEFLKTDEGKAFDRDLIPVSEL